MLYETLSDTVDAAVAHAQEIRAEINEEELRSGYAYDGVNYGQTKTVSAEIFKLKGKNTRKGFHVVVTRMDSGRYELVAYAL